MDTIYALSSGRPPAAIAIIRVSGPSAHAALSALAGPLPEPRVATVRVLRDPSSGEALDEVLILRFNAPHSATAEDLVELHCHGGRGVTAAILDALSRIEGLREAEPGEFTRRALTNGRIDLTEAEGLADLIEAETEAQRRAALTLADGGLRRQVEQWRERLVMLSAQAERAIDYADDDGHNAVDLGLLADARALGEDMGHWLAQPRVEPVKDGIRVVIAGPPNAGKSSLLNAIAGNDRAIVSAEPGTTRDYIEVPLSVDGMAIVLTDTAGLRDASDVEAIGIERSERQIASADILIWLGDEADAPDHPRRLDIRSKADLSSTVVNDRLAVSSLTGSGIAKLLSAIGTESRQLLPSADAVSLNRRQAGLLDAARNALHDATAAPDAAIVAHQLLVARQSLDRISGRAGVEDVLDALFSRFCLGK